MFRLGRGEVIHGVSVRLLLPAAPRRELIEKVDAALQLLARYAPRSHRWLKRYGRVLVHGAVGPNGEWHRDAALVLLCEAYVAAPSTHASHLAATIVHETAHAWLDHHGIQYAPERRRRIEAICLRAEARFAKRLPGGDELAEYYRNAAARILSQSDEEWSDAAFRARSIERLKLLDTPRWLTRAMGIADDEVNASSGESGEAAQK
jgi:hypothetical protein